MSASEAATRTARRQVGDDRVDGLNRLADADRRHAGKRARDRREHFAFSVRPRSGGEAEGRQMSAPGPSTDTPGFGPAELMPPVPKTCRGPVPDWITAAPVTRTPWLFDPPTPPRPRICTAPDPVLCTVAPFTVMPVKLASPVPGPLASRIKTPSAVMSDEPVAKLMLLLAFRVAVPVPEST